MFFDFATVVVYMVIAAGFVIGPLLGFRVLTWLTSPWIKPVRIQRPYDQKLATYECGEPTIGPSWVRFNIRFYIVALIFIIFDVEVVVLIPWTTVFRQLGLVGLIDMLIFVFILMAGLAYVWVKGDLDWIKAEDAERTRVGREDVQTVETSARKSA